MHKMNCLLSVLTLDFFLSGVQDIPNGYGADVRIKYNENTG